MAKIIYAMLAIALILIIGGCEDVAKALTTTISGTVYDEGATVGGAFIFVLESGDTVSAGMSLSNGTIGKSDGSYTIVDVVTGDHYICAIDDVEGNAVFDPGVDLIGYYGTVDTLLGISIPEVVTISEEGQDLEGIDILDMYMIPLPADS